MTQRQSRPCECGGRSCRIPSIVTRHEATLKHRKWRWERLCEAMLQEGTDKRAILRESKQVLIGA
jgi:hypothetical protein